eukprot:Partr_v1_DN28689_c4_g1_i1_m50508 putative alkaline ceramidase
MNNIYQTAKAVIGSRVAHIMATSHHEINGYWGKPSSTVDWCETNYSFSHYIAEFFNTLSSVAMIVCGLAGIYLHYRDFEGRFLWSFASVAMVGVGSAAFHGTLLFSLQMLDELPMIYSALIMTYIMIEHRNIKPKYSPLLPVALSVHAAVTTMLVASPAFFPQLSSPLLQFVCFHLSFAALQGFLLFKARQVWQEHKDSEARRVFFRGIALWFTGLACWIADYIGCDYLWEGENSFRVQYLTFTTPAFGSLKPFKFTLPNPQLHSWWHICASCGLYAISVFIAHHRAIILKKNAVITYKMGFLPVVSIVQRPVPARAAEKMKATTGKRSRSTSTKDIAVDSMTATPEPMRRRSRQNRDQR